MSFQIEESELVAEPLPKGDERTALMFYEAAEGGAGVLTRLASEPESLAQVASAALKLMHYNTPNGAWRFDELDALEQSDALGNRVCEAGCYPRKALAGGFRGQGRSYRGSGLPGKPRPILAHSLFPVSGDLP